MVLLPDSGRNYLSKIYNDGWMRDQGFTERFPTHPLITDLLHTRPTEGHNHNRPTFITVRSDQPVSEAIAQLHDHGISQMPVVARPRWAAASNRWLYPGADAARKNLQEPGDRQRPGRSGDGRPSADRPRRRRSRKHLPPIQSYCFGFGGGTGRRASWDYQPHRLARICGSQTSDVSSLSYFAPKELSRKVIRRKLVAQ